MMPCRVGVGVVIIRGDYVLLGRRLKEPYKGFLGCPGGSVDRETATDAAFREVFEETGLILLHAMPLAVWVDEGTSVKDGNPYVCVFLQGTLRSGDEPVNREPDTTESWEWHKVCDLNYKELVPFTGAAINEAFRLDNPNYPY